MNMFRQVSAKTVQEYLDSVPDNRKQTVLFLHNFIIKSAPKLKPHFAYNMLGYGSFPYKNYKGDLIEWPTVSLANQKNYVSIYICSLQDGEYIAEKNKSKLGKVSVGKSCIRFKKIEDVNLHVLKEIIQQASKHPGLSDIRKKAGQ